MVDTSIIPADQHFAVAAALFLIAYLGFWAEQKSWGKLVTGTVWTILGAILASNLGLIPKDAAVYSFVFTYIVPMLIPLFLMKADIRRIIIESGRVGIGFILACIGTSTGAIIGIKLLDLGTQEGDLAGIFAATYTGGSVNYAAVIQSTGFDDANMIAAATAVDNLMSAVFLAVLALLPASKWMMSKYAQRSHTAPLEAKSQTDKNSSAPTGYSLAASIAFALVVVALSDSVVYLLNETTTRFDFSRLRYVFITVLSVLPATLSPKSVQRLHGGETVGLVLAFVFFAAIAAGADVAKLVSVAPILLGFVMILLSVHALVVFGLGAAITNIARKLSPSNESNVFCLSLPELIIASNAAILGATTAPALAMARGWPGLATPGILVGVAGYIVGTPIGVTIALIF